MQRCSSPKGLHQNAPPGTSDEEHEKPHRNGGGSDVPDNPGKDGEMQRTGIIHSEEEVFELAREYFGLNEKGGAA